MSDPGDNPYFRSPDYARDVHKVARQLLHEIEERLAGAGDHKPLQDLPGYPAEYGLGKVLGEFATLSFLLNWSEEGCGTTIGSGHAEDASVSLAWLRNLLRRFADGWREDREDFDSCTFIGSLCAMWDETGSEEQGAPILTDVAATEEESRRDADESFEKSVRLMVERWKEEPSAVHLGFVLVPALTDELEKLDRIADQLGEELRSPEERIVCVSTYRFKRQLSIDPDELESLQRAVELLGSTVADGEAPGENDDRVVFHSKTTRPALTSGLGLGEGPFGKRNPRRIAKSSEIVAVFYEHRDWSNAQIAREIDADPGYVSRVLKPIRDQYRAQNLEDMPRGRKDRDGDFEAWQA